MPIQDTPEEASMCQESTAALTSDLQAVPELSHAGPVGGHTAIAAGIGEPGTGDLQALPIPGQAQSCSCPELLLPLVPGDVWGEAES